jgi:hypothetical protein
MKLYGNSGVPASGSKVTVLWLDSQLGAGGAVQGTEYALFVTAGGSVPDAIIGTKTTSGGWASLVAFEDNAAPVGAAVAASVDSDASIQVTVGGTPYYIPLYDSLAS